MRLVIALITQVNYEKNKSTKIKISKEVGTIYYLKKILNVLIDSNPNKEQEITHFKGFFTYFKRFNENKNNYYSKEAKSTGIANRIIEENLFIFLDNKIKFFTVLEKLPTLKNYEKTFH